MAVEQKLSIDAREEKGKSNVFPTKQQKKSEPQQTSEPHGKYCVSLKKIFLKITVNAPGDKTKIRSQF